MEVIGIFAVVVSLFFVGVQVRQSQKISMSQTYQSRTAAVAEWNSAFAANPASLSAWRKAVNGNESEITAEEYEALRRTLIALYYLFDNAHYQYQEGFVSADFWAMTRESLKGNMEIPAVNGVFLDISNRAGRPEFRDLVREINVQIQAHAGD